MPPWIGEVFRVLIWGSQNGWFGVACPAHCSFSLTLGFAVLSAGVGIGVVLTLFVVWYLLHPYLLQPAHPIHLPSKVETPRSRIAAYVHERRGHLD